MYSSERPKWDLYSSTNFEKVHSRFFIGSRNDGNESTYTLTQPIIHVVTINVILTYFSVVEIHELISFGYVYSVFG